MKLLYVLCLKSMLRNANKLQLTGKQKSQISCLIRKMEVRK